MNAVIYARYSSSNQKEASIEGQLRECKAYAKRNGIRIVNTYIDRALSAKTANRPAFQKMIKDSGKHSFDTVLVWKLDRFSRDRYDSAHYKHALKKNGVKVVSATETISKGSEGILLESMLEGMAEYYSVELSEKVRRGLTENALKCKFNGGTVPLGYTIDEERNFKVDPLTAPVVLDAFEKYSEGSTIVEIVDDMNNKGVRSACNKKITINMVVKMLHSRRYIGEYKYGDVVVPNGMPAIVSTELFQKVQDKMFQNKRAPAKHKAEDDYLLSPKLYCGYCNRLIVGESGTSKTSRVYHYYKCAGAKKFHDCKKKTVKKDWIENLVFEQIEKVIFNSEIIDNIVKEVLKEQEKEDTTLPLLKKDYADTVKSINNILKAIEQGIITESTKDRLENLEKQKFELSIQIEQEELARTMLTKEELMNWFKKLKRNGTKNLDRKRRLVNIFINSVYLFDDKVIINLNYKDGAPTVPVDEIINLIRSSDNDDLTPPKNPTSFDLSDFFIQADRLGISSRVSVYIITPKVCISVGLMICNSYGIDDIQGFALILYG